VLFPFINHWCCKLQQQHLQLWLGSELHAQCSWQPDLPLPAQLEHLFSMLPAAPAWRDSLEFIIDAPHINYLLVPWPQGITRPRELRQYARLLLAEQQGEQAGMKVSFLRSSFGEDAFAALLKKTLFASLKQLASQHRLRLTGCSTPFSNLLSRFGRTLPENALFASTGGQESSFALRWQHRWHSVFTLRLPHGDRLQQLDTANRLAGLPPLERYVADSGLGTPHAAASTREAPENNRDD